MADILSRRTPLTVKQAEEGDRIRPATVYIAPPNRHLLINQDGTLSLSQSELVHFVRPSADLLFESVAASYRDRSIAIVLTGTGGDGAMGVQAIKKMQGTVIAQDKDTSEFFGMPGAAIQSSSVDFILPLAEIPTALVMLVMFTPVDLKHRIFTKVPKPSMRDRLLVLAQAGDMEPNNHMVRQVRLRDMAFEVASEALVVVDIEGNLAMANERARTTFGLNRRDISRPFQDLELSYRPVELRSCIEQVYAEHLPVRLMNVERPFAGGDVQYLDVQVVPLLESDDRALGVSIVFRDVTHANRLQAELEKSKQELETAYEELQSTVEELETTNEELQSTNEELETMNEELQTLNTELRLRAAAIVVDHNLRVLIWSHRAEALWGLRADEAQGQAFPNLDIGLPIQHLVRPMQTVLRGESEYQELALSATNRRGRAIQCRVTCMPVKGGGTQYTGGYLINGGVGRGSTAPRQCVSPPYKGAGEKGKAIMNVDFDRTFEALQQRMETLRQQAVEGLVRPQEILARVFEELQGALDSWSDTTGDPPLLPPASSRMPL